MLQEFVKMLFPKRIARTLSLLFWLFLLGCFIIISEYQITMHIVEKNMATLRNAKLQDFIDNQPQSKSPQSTQTIIHHVASTLQNSIKPVNSTKSSITQNNGQMFCKYCVDPSMYGTVIELIPAGAGVQEYDMIILIMTSYRTDAYLRREAIRRTWGNVSLYSPLKVLRLFVLGQCKKCDLIKEEFAQFKDLAIFNFEDTYRNLTTKTLVSLNFVHQNYKAKFVFKVDDDIYVVYNKLLPWLNSLKITTRTIFGSCYGNVIPIRGIKSKYYVSQENYPEKKYPKMCFGTSYLLTGDTLGLLLDANKNNVSLTPLEDVSVGILSKAAGNVKLQNIKEWRTGGITENNCMRSYTVHALGHKQIVILHAVCKKKWSSPVKASVSKLKIIRRKML